MTTKTITRKDAEKVLAAILEQHKWAKQPEFDQPIIVEDWTWDLNPAPFAIVWEGGAYQWAYLFPYGGIEEEFGFKVRDVSDQLPGHVFVDAMTPWALGIYPNE